MSWLFCIFICMRVWEEGRVLEAPTWFNRGSCIALLYFGCIHFSSKGDPIDVCQDWEGGKHVLQLKWTYSLWELFVPL